MRARLLTVLVAGVLLSFAFEPLAWAWLMPLALAAFWVALAGTRVRQGVWLGLVFGAVFMGIHLFWMRTVGWDAWLLLSVGLTLFHGPLGGLASHVSRKRWWPIAVPVFWVAMEFARSTWPFGGMPWGRLAFGVIDTPLAPALPYVGTTGVGLLAALLGAVLAWLWLNRDRWRIGAVGLVALAAVITVPVLRPWSAPEVDTIHAALVQGDVPGAGNELLEVHREVTRNHVEATVELGDRISDGSRDRPDFVLWPENSTAVDPITDETARQGIEEAAEAVGVPILVGAMVDAGPRKILNQGIVWDPETGPGERYSKHHPVAFGEYLPFRDILEGWNIGRLAVVHSDMQAGTRTEPLHLGGHRIGDVICFDIAYDDVLYAQAREGAEAFTVQTSNALFVHTRQLDQQYAITRVRARELGRSVMVASTNGLTGVIGPDGETRAIAPRRTTTVLDAEVPALTALTPAVRMGEWPARIAGLATLTYLLVAVLAAMAARRRHREDAGENSNPESAATLDHDPAEEVGSA